MPGKTSIAKRSEVAIATLGLLGVIITGTLSNWDKLFGTVVEAKYSGYRPTGTFETELRYYFEVAGVRQASESMQAQLLGSIKADLLAKNPDDADEIASIVEAAAKEAPQLDDILRDLVPVYQKHFSLQEIQELNKFYSTELMQGLVRKVPLLNQDAAPIQVKMMNEFMERFQARLNDRLSRQ
ncbi:MAG: DUF2059 domain-containing protein [Vicinamibacterales bacterium]